MPTTLLHTSFYWENFIYFGMGPQRGEDGVLAHHLPDGRQRSCRASRAEDIGKVAYGDLQGRRRVIGQTVGIAGENLTGARDGRGLLEGARRGGRYNAVPADVYRGFGFPGADELGNMFQFNGDSRQTYCGQARSRSDPDAQPGAPGLQCLARREQEPDPDRMSRAEPARRRASNGARVRAGS